VIRSDLALMFASLLHAIDRARRVGDEARVHDMQWHLAALWAHVGELLTMVCEECAAWAAGAEGSYGR
jgi:hypothetical protein